MLQTTKCRKQQNVANDQNLRAINVQRLSAEQQNYCLPTNPGSDLI
jgi:hypothetical protein